MPRKAWIYIDGVAYDKDDHDAIARARGHYEPERRTVVSPDLPDFVSPIDGKQYSGRTGLREHCARHNVVPTADLAGLPPKPMLQEIRRTPEQVARNKRVIAEIINSKM